VEFTDSEVILKREVIIHVFFCQAGSITLILESFTIFNFRTSFISVTFDQFSPVRIRIRPSLSGFSQTCSSLFIRQRNIIYISHIELKPLVHLRLMLMIHIHFFLDRIIDINSHISFKWLRMNIFIAHIQKNKYIVTHLSPFIRCSSFPFRDHQDVLR
jgi:hypothetical protein